MYDLLPLLWPRSGATMLGCAICCRCFRLPMLRCAICCCCFGLEVVPGAKMYDLLPLLWSRVMLTICCCCFGRVCDLLLLLWFRSGGRILRRTVHRCFRFPSGAPMLRSTVCCRCFGFEVEPQCWDARFVAVALASKRCPISKMYDLLPSLWPRSGKMYDLLPLLWFRSGAPMLLFTICCRCFGFAAVPQFEDV